ncbi:MAG: FliO/MopB family protein [Alkalispirochaetaceae bacterium]
MLKTGRETLKRLLLALLLAALCPLFAYSQDAGAGAESNRSQEAPREDAAGERPASELELRFADEGGESPDNEAVAPVTEFTIWDFLRMVLVLGFVVALIYGLLYLLKRSQGSPSQESGVIDLVATQSLPGSGMVHLIKVGTQLFMLGSSEHSLRLLTEIEDKESRDEIELRAARKPREERRSFSDLMSAMAGGLGGIARSSGNGSGNDSEREREADVSDRPAEAPEERAASARVSEESSAAAASGERTTAEARAEQEVLDFISSQRQRLRRLNS